MAIHEQIVEHQLAGEFLVGPDASRFASDKENVLWICPSKKGFDDRGIG
jgi:hypothetical protein